MSDSIKRVFSIINTNVCEMVTQNTVNDDGTVTVREVVQPVIKDGKKQYTKNIRLACDNDPNYTFPPVIKVSILNKLAEGKEVKLMEDAKNYVLQRRNGVISPTQRPKDIDGKIVGYCTQVYVAEYVRQPGKACAELG